MPFCFWRITAQQEAINQDKMQYFVRTMEMKWIVLGIAVAMYAIVVIFPHKKAWATLIAAIAVVALGQGSYCGRKYKSVEHNQKMFFTSNDRGYNHICIWDVNHRG